MRHGDDASTLSGSVRAALTFPSPGQPPLGDATSGTGGSLGAALRRPLRDRCPQAVRAVRHPLPGAFSILALIPFVALVQLGLIIAFGVLLDTLLVRSVIVPAMVLTPDRASGGPAARTAS